MSAAEAEASEARMALLGRSLAEEARLLVRPHRLWMEAEHVFSHIRWDVQVYAADFGFFLEEADAADGIAARRTAESAESYLASHPGASLEAASRIEADDSQDSDADRVPQLAHADMSKLPEGYRWIGPEDMAELAFPNVFLRILNAYWERESNAG